MYREYGPWLTELMGCKTQKISLNAGFTCPNRDGSIGVGGCTYCNNQTFNPAYCQTTKSITQQLQEGKQFFSRKYPQMKYLAYFQAYTNTYGELEDLKSKYEEALSVEDVIGLVIGTRPDCMPQALLDYLSEINSTPCAALLPIEGEVPEGRRGSSVIVEYGLESVYDKTLIRINRGHTHAQSVDAITRTASRNIPVGAHIILGLPGESRQEFIDEAKILSDLPITTLKLHQLQLIKGTRMAEEYFANPSDFHLFEVDEYIDLVLEFISHLRSDIVLERFVSQSPTSLLAVPGWGLKNYEFNERVKKRMVELNF